MIHKDNEHWSRFQLDSCQESEEIPSPDPFPALCAVLAKKPRKEDRNRDVSIVYKWRTVGEEAFVLWPFRVPAEGIADFRRRK
jgi:hypothetical protein